MMVAIEFYIKVIIKKEKYRNKEDDRFVVTSAINNLNYYVVVS